MDHARAQQIVDALANGINPLTGEIIPAGNLLQQSDIVRALFLAGMALRAATTKSKKTAAREANLPSKAGAAWAPDEDEALVAAFDAGSTEKMLAEAHQRTPGAIRSRLIKLGKLEAPPSYRG